MKPLNPQNGIFRVLQIEMREPDGVWKRVRGDEPISDLKHGVRYEVRVLNPAFTVGIGIDGETVMVPEKILPLSD